MLYTSNMHSYGIIRSSKIERKHYIQVDKYLLNQTSINK